MSAKLFWHFGPMASGKTTMALQLNYNLRACGRRGVLFTRGDRSGHAVISSRLGISADAVEVTDDTDLFTTVQELTATAEGQISYVIVDEAQFLATRQIDQLGSIVDDLGIPVSAFGIASDFTATLFAGSRRLFEIADEHVPLTAQVPVYCWCARPARMNARVVGDVMVTEGEQVVVGDTTGDTVRYVLLCRKHFRAGQHTAPPAEPTLHRQAPLMVGAFHYDLDYLHTTAGTWESAHLDTYYYGRYILSLHAGDLSHASTGSPHLSEEDEAIVTLLLTAASARLARDGVITQAQADSYTANL